MRNHLTYANVMSSLAALFALSGGVAYAANTIGSSDIIDGQVKTADLAANAVNSTKIGEGQVSEADIGQAAVTSSEIKNDAVTNADVAPDSLTSARIADATLTGADVAQNSLKGADVDEATLDIGDAARAYARVRPVTCTGAPGDCTPEQSKGISSVTKTSFPGAFCVTAPGIDGSVTPAAVTVETSTTLAPGNTSAMTIEGGFCGPQKFAVLTTRQPEILVDAGGGNNNEIAVGPAVEADDVGFTIVIP